MGHEGREDRPDTRHDMPQRHPGRPGSSQPSRRNRQRQVCFADPAERLRAGADAPELRGIPGDESRGARHLGASAQPILLCRKLHTTPKRADTDLREQDGDKHQRSGRHEESQSQDGEHSRDGQPEHRHDDPYLGEHQVLKILDRCREDVGAGASPQPGRGERHECLVCRHPPPREEVQGAVV